MTTNVLTRVELASILGVRPERLSSLGADAGLSAPTDKRSYSSGDLSLLVRHLKVKGSKVPLALEPFAPGAKLGSN
jgi:hypothetical protein